MKKDNYQYEMIHDNLNNQWFIADLSHKKYNFYSKCNTIKFIDNINNIDINKKNDNQKPKKTYIFRIF